MEALLKNIPMPPSVNGIYTNATRGEKVIRVKSTEMNLWEINADDWAIVNGVALRDARAVISKRAPGQALYLNAYFWFQRKAIYTKEGAIKRNDTSNRLKPLHDTLAAYLHIDDSLFWNGSFTKLVVTVGAKEWVDVSIGLVDL